MLLLVTCPNCRYVGATAATLPRVLVCSACGQGALIKRRRVAVVACTNPRRAGGGLDTLRGGREGESGRSQLGAAREAWGS